jgi:hypothetical protein
VNKRRALRQGSGKHRRQSLLVDEIFLQPWFLSQDTACAIRRIIPDLFLNKMRYYFEDWGCLVCGSKRRIYMSNGMCKQCVTRIRKRLFSSLERRRMTASEGPASDLVSGEERVRSARILLCDLARGGWSPNRMKLRKIKWVD